MARVHIVAWGCRSLGRGQEVSEGVNMMDILSCNLTASVVTAWATILAAIAAFFAVGATVRSTAKQIDNSRFVLGVDLLFKMDERFNSKGMKRTRSEGARALLDRGEQLSTARYENADDILDFFETLGLMTRRGALDKEMVWSTFFPWIEVYWLASQEYVKSEMIEELETWKDFKNLYERMVVVEKIKTKKPYMPLTSEEKSKFLHDELDLE